jgi:hypothetical protein
MLYVHLTQSQRDELSVVSRQAIGRVARLSHLVLLSDRGFTVAQIAAIHACGEDVVRTWLHRYEQQGVAGLQDEPRESSTPQGPLGRTGRRCSSQPIAALLGACPSRLACLLAHRLPLAPISPGPLVCVGPALVAPDGLALGTPTAGACSQTRPAGPDQKSRSARGASASQARAGPSAVPGRVGPASLAAHPSAVDERATGAHPDPWDQSASRLLRRAGCRERAVVLCRS